MKPSRPLARLRVLAAVLTGLTLPQAARADVVLQAATANPDTKPEVRLRWTVSGKDWLPDGGFNLYRVENGTRRKLNQTPITPADPGTTKTVTLGARSTLADRHFNYGEVITRARTRPAGVQDADLAVIQPPIIRPPSSGGVFDAMAARIKTLNETRGPGLTAQELDNRLGQSPELKTYYNRVRPAPPAQPRTLIGNRPRPTEIDLVRQARLNLITSALLYPEVAHAVGLAYEDAAVTKGAHLQYALREVVNGTEAAADAATADIVVGADPQPPAPTALKAMERDADTVDLRWERLPQNQEKGFGMVSYDILRTDPGAAQGIRLNKIPVVVGSLSAGGGYIEPASFFRDHPAPVGTLSYQVIMIDMFGRQSPPATVSFEMKEWHTPPPPKGIYAEYANGATTVTWTPSAPDPGSVPKSAAGRPIRYHVYRVDIEKRPISIDLLSSDSFNGVFAPGVAQSMKSVLALVPQSRSLYAAARYGKPAPTHELMFGKSRKANAAISTRMTADRFMAIAGASSGQADAAKRVTAALQLGFLSYADTNPPKDHYYRYLVTAQYETSARESVPVITNRIPVPLDTPSPAPTGLKFTFGPPQKDTGQVSEAVILKGKSGRGMSVATEASRMGAGKWAQASDFRKKNFKLTPSNRAPDIGGTLVLQWDPVQGTKPITYRVYRANAYDYFLPAAPPAATSPAAAGTANENAGARAARTLLARTGKMISAGAGRSSAHGDVNLKQIAATAGKTEIEAKAYSLLGQAQDDGGVAGPIKFEEDLPQTQAHYYQYRVVPVNRWGIAGSPADLLVRVPATMPPTSPGLKTVAANLAGSVDISVTPDDLSEEVVKYHIFRKPVPVVFTASDTSGRGSHNSTAERAINSVDIVDRSSSKDAIVALNGTAQPAQKNPENFSADPIAHNAGVAPTAFQNAKTGVPAAKIGETALGAHGTLSDSVGAGAARFGAVHHASGSTLLAKGLAVGKLSPSLLAMLANIGWEEIGVVTPAQTTDGSGNPAWQVSTQDTTATPQVEYLYRVVAEDSDGLMSVPSTPMDATPLRVKSDPPGPVTLTPGSDPKHKSAIVVTWGASATPGLLGYIVKRSTQSAQGAAGPSVQLSGILQQPTATFTDFTSLPGHTYVYQVFALDNSGNLSDPSSATVTK